MVNVVFNEVGVCGRERVSVEGAKSLGLVVLYLNNLG